MLYLYLQAQAFARTISEDEYDLDIKTKGITLEKKSFMNLEITLYVENQFDVKSKEIKNTVKDILLSVINDGLTDKKLFNFYKSKK